MNSFLSDHSQQRCRLIPLTLALGLFSGMLTVAANQVTYQVDMRVQRTLGNFNPANGDTAIVSGTFTTTDWTTASVLSPSAGDSNIYSGTFNNNVNAGNYEQHKFIINPGGNSGAGQLVWESGDNRFFQVTAGNQTLPVVYFDNVTNAPATTNAGPMEEFIAGADMSHLQFFEDRGITYRVNGQTQDALSILKNRGVNCVRLRLFTSSAAQAQADPYNYTNNLAYTLPLAVRVKNAGLKLLLDFHYSDSWADPGKQTKPAAWTNLTFPQLKTQLRDYNSNTIAAFSSAGALPDYVQIGNEITPGMLWDEGRVGGSFDTTTQWSQLAQLLTNAIQGVKDAAGTNMTKIIIHLDRGGDWGTTQWYFDNLTARQVSFDIIGESYYPWWHGDFTALRTCLTNAAARYHKPVMIMEPPSRAATPPTSSDSQPRRTVRCNSSSNLRRSSKAFLAAGVLASFGGAQSISKCQTPTSLVFINAHCSARTAMCCPPRLRLGRWLRRSPFHPASATT